jgi:hypothetical protein
MPLQHPGSDQIVEQILGGCGRDPGQGTRRMRVHPWAWVQGDEGEHGLLGVGQGRAGCGEHTAHAPHAVVGFAQPQGLVGQARGYVLQPPYRVVAETGRHDAQRQRQFVAHPGYLGDHGRVAAFVGPER